MIFYFKALLKNVFGPHIEPVLGISIYIIFRLI